MTFVEHDAIRTDPTRMAQGIMTGIGFLGAGVIFKEGLTVRGLTTAASIWVTAAIGILVGIGFWFAAIVGAVAALVGLFARRCICTASHWQPNFSSQARSGQTDSMPKKIRRSYPSHLRECLTAQFLANGRGGVSNLIDRLL
jgi:uncharacterized membrane protein YhiD involved in acid resistance